MEKLHEVITIKASRKKVWKTMLELETYKIWTTPFCEGSYYEGSWKKGAKIHFLSPDGGGMVSEIAELTPESFVSIRHLGYIVNGKEDTESPEIKAWAPSYENYTLTEKDGVTTVSIDMDITQEYAKYMRETWPKALQSLKKLCE